MANADSTLQSTEETRAGAMAGRDALRAINNIAERGNPDSSFIGWWNDQDDAVVAMLRASGIPIGFMAGFVAVMAEYLMADFSGCGFNLDSWEKPEAAMTNEEKALSRIEFERQAEEVKTPSQEDIIRANEVRELNYKKAFERAQNWLRLTPDNAGQYKKRVALQITNMAKICSENAAKIGGYCLMGESDKNLQQAIAKVDETIMGASVSYSPADHEQHRRDLVRQAFEQELAPYLEGADEEVYWQRLMVELLAPIGNEADAVHV